jgi:hypothetical protein
VSRGHPARAGASVGHRVGLYRLERCPRDARGGLGVPADSAVRVPCRRGAEHRLAAHGLGRRDRPVRSFGQSRRPAQSRRHGSSMPTSGSW